MSDWQHQFAARVLHKGGVIAYPTEAVWGLGCDPHNAAAVLNLLRLKHRSVSKGLILIAADIEQFAPILASISPTQRAQLEQSWPGFQTWIVPDRDNVAPRWVKGDHSAVALRVSAHPQVRRLCQAFGGPLVSTSANYTGREPARDRLGLAQQFGSQLDYILPGKLLYQGPSAKPSPIHHLETGEAVRL